MNSNPSQPPIRFSPRFTKRQWVSLVLLLIYLDGRFIFGEQLDQLVSYGSYLFELIFALAVWGIFRRRISFRFPPAVRLALDAGVWVVLGYALYKISAPLKLLIPFDLEAGESIFLLLIVGPILEELIFRMAIWELFSEFISKPVNLLISTSLLFSFAHFFAWWSVPENMQPFVLYQTVYTFGLGVYCGFRRMETNSITPAIWVHFFFNAGFCLAYVF